MTKKAMTPYTVLAGNRRRVAVEALGWEDVPAIIRRKNGHGTEDELARLPVRDLAPHVWNPRDLVEIDALAASINAVGLQNPLIVTPNDRGSSILGEPLLMAQLWAEQNEQEPWPPARSVRFYQRVHEEMTNGRRRKLDDILRAIGMTDGERRLYSGAGRLGPKALAFGEEQGLSVGNLNHIANYAARTLANMGKLPPSVNSDRVQLLVARKYALAHGGIPRGESQRAMESYTEAVKQASQTQIMAFLTDVGQTVSSFRLSLGLPSMAAKRTHADAITRTVNAVQNLSRLNIDPTLRAHRRALRQLSLAFKELRAQLGLR